MHLYVLKLEEGDCVPEALKSFISSRGLKGGLIVGIGALSYAEIGVFKGDSSYEVFKISASKPYAIEVAPLVGNYYVKSGEVRLHLHATLSTVEAGGIRVLAGHLLKAMVKPKLEIFLVEVGENVSEVFG